MTAAIILCDWFLRVIGEARATELLQEEKLQRTLVRRQRKTAARKLRRQRTARADESDLSAPDSGEPDLAELRSKGWTIRPAARQLGVSSTHLYLVLRGKRQSRSLMQRFANLSAKS